MNSVYNTDSSDEEYDRLSITNIMKEKKELDITEICMTKEYDYDWSAWSCDNCSCMGLVREDGKKYNLSRKIKGFDKDKRRFKDYGVFDGEIKCDCIEECDSDGFKESYEMKCGLYDGHLYFDL
tara:strand:- start:3598 stop:3969 length:372 start_codon:yes stop_codon:yes gene_type:complete